MNSEQKISKALSYSESAMIKGIINRTLIVEWGTIKKVVAKGVVDVLLSVTDRPEKTTVVTCVLLSPCSASFSIDIEPQVEDKVLVLSPRHFDPKMFGVGSNTEVIERPDFTGYNNLCCMAILYNQFRNSTHKQSISIASTGVITMANTDANNSLTIDLSDKNNHKIMISDSNGMTIESSSSSTVINGNLEIKVGSSPEPETEPQGE